MKKSLFLYLFIFAVLINIFTYMYFTKKQKHEEERIVNLEKRVNELTGPGNQNPAAEADAEANYFALETNDNAMEYFGDDADIADIVTRVKEGISELNTKPEGNPLTQQEPINGEAFRINKVHLLNNRWIIADYSNGTAWGEVLIKYFINEDGTVDYEPIQTLLHANTVK